MKKPSFHLVILFLLGFSSGLPLALTGSTLSAWMSSLKVDLTVIGAFSLVGLPYSLKFLFAPLMDRYSTDKLGRRRTWMLLTQFLLIFGLLGLSLCDPAQELRQVALCTLFIALVSSMQDIAIDAYRTETLEKAMLGVGAATAILGYRIGMLFSGAFALILSDHVSWNTVYQIMAFTMGIGILSSWMAKEPRHPVTPSTLKKAVIEPFVDFFKRYRAGYIVSFVLLYKADVILATALMTPFMMELGFSRTDIGTVSKGFGLLATIAGAFCGGVIMTWAGLKRSLILFGVLQGISGSCFYFLAKLGHHYPMMVTAIAAENFFSGMGTSAYAAFLMSLCNPAYTATQYALLTSLMALTSVFVGPFAGWLATTAGWPNYFLISIGLMIPGLLLLSRFDHWQHSASE